MKARVKLKRKQFKNISKENEWNWKWKIKKDIWDILFNKHVEEKLIVRRKRNNIFLKLYL